MDDNDNELMQRINALDTKDRDRLKRLVRRVMEAYVSEDILAVVLTQPAEEDDILSSVYLINCGVMEAYNIAETFFDYMAAVNADDAPPKELFN